MGIFNTLLSKIFGLDTEAHAEQQLPQATSDSSAPPVTAQTSTSALTQAVKPAPMNSVDVTARLDTLAKESKEKLSWKTSIVDLMKLVGMDSSLTARKELAKELHYPGDGNDSAAMNVWLHMEVLKKISENGGTVPKDLAD